MSFAYINFKPMFKVYTFILLFILLGSCALRDTSTEPISEDLSMADTTVIESIGYEEIQSNLESSKYQATETVFTDLIHTRLEVNFDWANSRMNGVAFITAKPHFYPSDSLILDAKGMDILKVQMAGKDLVYTYDSEYLKINLGKTYNRSEPYTVKIDYIAKPDDRKTKGGAAITSDKGLFFINPKGDDPKRMPQIWTQGETESSSVWFPTIDAPNVKTSQEILITVDDKYATLSNGKLLSSKKSSYGTRIDHWKQDLPHAPYLFMLGIGEFKVVKDFYTRKDGSKMEVNYYVEKEWEQYARDIFGETPKMIEYFSKLLMVEYPWDKYHQIVVRDYVSGAMENTGAVVFGDYAYKTKRDLLDGNDQSTIAHELFHHWFGDLVTAESWANLTLNESFANYSQYLWDEYRFGRDEADYQAMGEEDGYYQSASMGGYHELAWFHYGDKEQMFDGHSYNKGGRILHMLRNYLGDEAFFMSISKYLNDNKFKAAEYHQLRLAFEEVTGEDLNWFFKQWYEAKGHPVLKVSQALDVDNQTVTLSIEQNQDVEKFALFRLPVDVEVHDSNGKKTHRIWVDEQTEEFSFPFNGILRAVIFDKDKMLLAKIDEKKPQEQLIYQFYNSDRFETRAQSLQNGVIEGSLASDQMILDGLNDGFWNIREMAIQKSNQLSAERKDIAIKIIKNLMVSDPDSKVRAAAVSFLTKNTEEQDLAQMLKKAIDEDQSYLVIGTALKQLGKVDSDLAMTAAKNLESESSAKILAAIAQIYMNHGTETNAPFFKDILMNKDLGTYSQLEVMNFYTMFNARMDEDQIEKSLEVYQHLNTTGGYYTKMFLGQNIDHLTDVLAYRREDLEKEKASAIGANDSLKLAEVKEKISKINLLLTKFETFLKEE
jgi:aminopeptidase N